MRINVAALAILALAFFARVYRLADKNIWWDEGWTVWLAQHDWAWIALRTASDEHPPLHYWLMNLWQGVFGPDVVTGRFFSLAFGVLGVALLYRIGKAMGGARVGLLAALFLALARFNIWWSQDIKNYTLSAFFAWASVWFTWMIVERSNVQTLKRSAILPYAGYILCAALALFSHYLAALILLASNVFVGIFLLMQWRAGKNPLSLFLKWGAAQIAVVVLLAPWLYLYLQNGATWTAAPAFDFGLFLRLAATVLSLGVTTYIENYIWVVLGLMGIAALSVGWLIRRQTTDGRQQTTFSAFRLPPSAFASGTFYMFLVVLIPPALIYILSLTPAAIFAPKIQARYLMMLTPALMLLLALGILFAARYSKFVAAALAVFVVGAQLFTLTPYYGERILRDEYTSVAQMINNFGADDDAVVLNTDQEYPTFLYYLSRRFSSARLFAWIGVPNGAQVNDATAQRVAADALQHRGVWIVTIPDALQRDPQRLVEQKIAERLPKQYEQTFGDKRLALYADSIRNVKDAAPENFSPLVARSDVLDERLKLLGVDLPVREALPGDIVRVVTYWAAQDVTTLNVSLQKTNGEIVANASYPISIGARERAQTDLQIPPDVNANELRVVAQARLGALPLGTLHILPRANAQTASDANMQARAERFGNAIRLMGVNIPSQKFRAGELVPVTLVWQTDAPLATSYTVFVHLLGEQYNPAQDNFLWGQIDRIPVDGKLPTNAWTPQQNVVDVYQVKLDDNAPPGIYKIEIGLYDANGARLRVFDANGNDLGDALIGGEFEIGN